MIIRKLGHDDIAVVHALMLDVVSRLPQSELYATDDEEYLHTLIRDRGEIYGAYKNDRLIAYSVIAFPGFEADNLAREFGVPQNELLRVASLNGTVVHESARGQGLQLYFHNLREEQARAYGCLHLYSTVHPDNHASRKNLEAHGFTLQFTKTMYGGLPRHCYAKRLT